MGDSRGSLTQFWALFTVISCAPKNFKHLYNRYFSNLGSLFKHEGPLKVQVISLQNLAIYFTKQQS